MKKIKYNKIIIWGHPLYSHTHSYVHESYYKAFKYLGYDVYWFHDDDFPNNFDFNNCLFIGEGFADKKIPINDSSCYLIMYCPSPSKYAKAERYIDIRMAAVNFKDHIHDYSLNKNSCIRVGPASYYENKTDNKIKIKNDYVDYEMDDYEKIYISWATNLLPHEFDFDEIRHPRENKIYYCGTISGEGICENYSNFKPFIEECKNFGIQFIHNNPWSNPLSSQEVINRTKRSLLGVDIRGQRHVDQGLLTCRVFKNISYGHLGITNSKEMYNALEGNCIYNSDTAQLFYDGLKNKGQHDIIKLAMKFVQENHTYLNRINSLLSVIGGEIHV